MSRSSPSSILTAAADRLRDLAAAATPGPWVHRFAIKKADETIDYAIDVASDTARMAGVGEAWNSDDAVWIAALSPAVSPALERWLRETAVSLERHEPVWRDQPDVYDHPIVRRTPDEVAALIEHHYGAALTLARQVLGAGEEQQR